MPHTQHDNSYKLLFSHPQMVEDLLKGFVPEDWVKQVDFSTLEKMNNDYVTDDLRGREDDIIWRVRWRHGDWLYVYLLLEFQSSTDKYMAVRMLTYVGLLYQDIIKQKQLPDSGKLPAVLPLVLYNGRPRWQAAMDIAELIEKVPGGLEKYRPSLKYLLLDEGALDESSQQAVRNLAAALFSLEKSTTLKQVDQVIGSLLDWLQAPEQMALRRAFTVWIKRVLLPVRMPGTKVPKLHDLQEVKTMLAEQVIDWTKEWEQKGVQKGRQEGEYLLLNKQLTRRFGSLPVVVQERLMQASTDELELWAERILDAQSLDEVFELL